MTKTQPKEGQAYNLPKAANTDERTTHVAVNKKRGFKYFCWFDTEYIVPHEGVSDEDVHGTYWIIPNHLYGRCYNGASLWQGGFDFTPLEDWTE